LKTSLRKIYGKQDIIICPFNATHHVLEMEQKVCLVLKAKNNIKLLSLTWNKYQLLQLHLTTCSDRALGMSKNLHVIVDPWQCSSGSTYMQNGIRIAIKITEKHFSELFK
jgi:hypothetical protein